MQMSDNERRSILEGLDLLVEKKRLELQVIRNKTESDYESLKGIYRLLHKTEMDWKENRLEEVFSKQKEIEDVHRLHRLYDSNRNQVLVVPHTVQINLNIKN